VTNNIQFSTFSKSEKNSTFKNILKILKSIEILLNLELLIYKIFVSVQYNDI